VSENAKNIMWRFIVYSLGKLKYDPNFFFGSLAHMVSADQILGAFCMLHLFTQMYLFLDKKPNA
jgi:hypothetical protein